MIADDAVDADWLIEWSMENMKRRSHQNYLFNFRYDETSESCLCGDAATSPTPPNSVKHIGPVRVDVYDDDGNLSSYEHLED